MDLFKAFRGCKHSWPRWMRALGVFSKSKFVHIALFLAINVVVGSLGVWMPILASIARPDIFAREELIKVLLAGGPYTFAVAYLAGSSSFLVNEYLDEEAASNRRWKTFLGLVAFLLIIVCTLLSALQTPPGASAATPTSSSPGTAVSTTPLSPSPGPTEMPNTRSHEVTRDLNLSEVVQLQITVLAIIVGLGLFMVSRLGDKDLKEQLAAIYKEDVAASQNLAQLAANATSLGLKV